MGKGTFKNLNKLLPPKRRGLLWSEPNEAWRCQQWTPWPVVNIGIQLRLAWLYLLRGGGGGINSLFPTARDVYFSTWKFPEAADRIVLPVRPSIHPFIHSSADIPEILVC